MAASLPSHSDTVDMNGGRRTALANRLPGAVTTDFSAGLLARANGMPRENFVLASVSTSTGPSCSTLRCVVTDAGPRAVYAQRPGVHHEPAAEFGGEWMGCRELLEGDLVLPERDEPDA